MTPFNVKLSGFYSIIYKIIHIQSVELDVGLTLKNP